MTRNRKRRYFMFGHALLPSGGGGVVGADPTPPVKPDGAAPAGRVASM